MIRTLRRIMRDQKAATAVEYGLIIAMVVLAMFAALSTVASGTINMWGNISTNVLKS